MSQQLFSSKIKLVSGETVILLTRWCEESLKVFVINQKSEVLEGEIGWDEFEEIAEAFDQAVEEFLAVNKRLLTTNSSEASFSLENLKFTWFKQSDAVKIKYGSLTLKSSKVQVFDLLHQIGGELLGLRTENEKLNIELCNSRSQHEDLEVEYEKKFQERLEAEKTLLAKFQCLLNSKKRLIAELLQGEDSE